MVYGIARKHEGYIDVESEVGKGTTFSIFLPVFSKWTGEAEQEMGVPVTDGTETILIAEDDPIVRTGLRTMFERAGYKVIEATDGKDAVVQFMNHSGKVQFLLLDAIMPGKSGEDAHNEIRRMNPDIKALFISGYKDNLDFDRRMADEGLIVLPKPFSPNVLLSAVRDILDEAGVEEGKRKGRGIEATTPSLSSRNHC